MRILKRTQLEASRLWNPATSQPAAEPAQSRFRCVGCTHFRSNPSYLPELETYLADLLRNHETLPSVFDADDWAIAEAMPSQRADLTDE